MVILDGFRFLAEVVEHQADRVHMVRLGLSVFDLTCRGQCLLSGREGLLVPSHAIVGVAEGTQDSPVKGRVHQPSYETLIELCRQSHEPPHVEVLVSDAKQN